MREELIAEVCQRAQFQPDEPFPGSGKPWPGIHIPCGRPTAPIWGNLQQGRGCCKHCAGQAPPDPETLAARCAAAGFEPDGGPGTYPGSGKPWPGIHKACGKPITPRWDHIKAGRKLCPHCSNHVVAPEDLERRCAELGFLPDGGPSTYPGARSPWPGVHLACGRHVQPRWDDLRKPGRGCCNYCAGRVADRDRMAQRLLEIEFAPHGGIGTYPAANTPWPGIHLACGREVAPYWTAIQQGGGCCAYCAGIKTHPDDFPARCAEAAFEPAEPYPGNADQPWTGTHLPCGTHITTAWRLIRRGLSGCPECSVAFNENVTHAYVYLIAADDGARKIGVSKSLPTLRKRLGNHRALGFTTELARLGPMPGTDALRIETRFLDTIRTAGAPPARQRQDGWGGWTETYWATDCPDPTALQLVHEIH